MVQQWCDQTPSCINQQEMVTVLFTEDRDLKGLKELILPGHTLQLTTDIRYFGLILGEGLTWKGQLKLW